MPILSSEIQIKLSVTTGSSGNSTAQGNVNNSLGKYLSTTALSTGINNLFDNISGDENASSGVDYRCIFIHNTNTTGTLYNTVVWISGQVSGGADITIGLDPSGNVVQDSAGAQAVLITSETGVPAGVTFSNPTTKASGLSIGDLSPLYCRGIWLKRTATNSSAINNDGVTLSHAGDTGA